MCGDGLDCVGTKFDSCMAYENCWFNDTQPCSSTAQLAISQFLQCFEGPYANTDTPANETLIQPCMAAAGLNYEQVMNCVNNDTTVENVMWSLNTTREGMYEKLGPTPGYFPHIFLDGNHLYNNSWASLVRIICDKVGYAPAKCAPKAGVMHVTIYDSPYPVATILEHAYLFEQAVQTASDFAVSQETFPINFNTSSDEPDGAPSYVNVKALLNTSLRSALVHPVRLDSTEGTSAYSVDLVLDISILSAFGAQFNLGCNGTSLIAFMTWALTQNGFSGLDNRIYVRCDVAMAIV